MLKTILRTTLFTFLGIGICMILGLGAAIFALGDPMPTGITLENRSKDTIEASFYVKSSRQQIDQSGAIASGQSGGVYLDVRDKDVVYDIVVTRHRSQTNKPKYRFKGSSGDREARLVFTNSNKLERYELGERLPAVVP